MLDDKDINKLANVFATKQDLEVFATKKDLEVFATKGDLMLLEEKMKDMIEPLATKLEVSELLTAVDNYAKKADTYFQEMLAMNSRINRLERWVQEIAKKMDLELTS